MERVQERNVLTVAVPIVGIRFQHLMVAVELAIASVCLSTLKQGAFIGPTKDFLIKSPLAYLLIGSYGVLIWEWRKGQKLKAETLTC